MADVNGPDPEQRLAKFQKALGDKDPYEVIGVEETSSDSVIRKAYKKKALKLHPDRNRDKPNATEIFQVLVQASELLADEAVKALYDAGLRKQKAAKLRDQKMNAEQRAAKMDLEAREQAFKKRRMDTQTAARSMEQEIARLREDGERRLREQQQRAAAAKAAKASAAAADFDSRGAGPAGERGEGDAGSGGTPTLKVKWHTKGIAADNGGYSVAELTRLFSKYGGTPTVMLKKKDGAALVAFDTAASARNASKYESGLPSNPFKELSWVAGSATQPSENEEEEEGGGGAGATPSEGRWGGGGSKRGRVSAQYDHGFGFVGDGGGGATVKEGEGGFGAGGGAGGRGVFDVLEAATLRRMLAAGGSGGVGGGSENSA